MIRTIIEREIIIQKDDEEMITGMLVEFNAEIVGRYTAQAKKNLVKLVVMITTSEFDEVLDWFDKNYDGMISVVE